MSQLILTKSNKIRNIIQTTEKYVVTKKDTSTDTSKGSANTTESGTASNADVPNYTEQNGDDTNTYTSEKSSETTNYELDSTIQEIKNTQPLQKQMSLSGLIKML